MLQTITLVLTKIYLIPTKDEEDNKLRESRSRAHKALKDLCPAALLAAYSYSSPAASNSANNGYVLQSFHAFVFFIYLPVVVNSGPFFPL